MNSRADVSGDRILVHPSFGDMFRVARIPGGKWDSARSAWSFPATEQTAAAVRDLIPGLATADAFEALLHPAAAEVAPDSAPAPAAKQPEPLPAPVVVAPPEPEIVVPPGLKTAPWPHQKQGFKFSVDKFDAGFYGLLLAMGMGTGKTLVAFMIMLYLRAMTVMILAPLRVAHVWLTQIAAHVGIELIAVALDEEVGSVAKKQKLAEEKMRLARTLGIPFICVINYDSAWREPFASWAIEKAGVWDLVILDEAHRIKAPGGKASLFCKRLRPRARRRVALTGTPLPHGLVDAYGPVRFLDNAIFGSSFHGFRQNYTIMGGYQNKQIVGFRNLEDFERRLSKITFRVSKDVLSLPEQMHVVYYCELGPEAKRAYRDLEEDLVARVLDGTVTASNVLVKLLRLQQLTGGTLKLDDGTFRRVDYAKQKLAADTLEDIGPSEPVIIFCRFHADLDAIHEACEQNGFTSLELSGRRDELKRWQDGEAQVLAVQISAGGVGVDLTRARYTIYYSLSFSLGEYDQSLSRVHRPGQTRPVEHIHLVARGTVDQRIMRALEKRAEVVESILAEIKQ